MWLDGKDVNGDRGESASSFLASGKVGSWADRSGNANTRTQATSANQTTYSTGGGLNFDGNDFMTGSLPNSLTGNPGFTAIIVADATSNDKQVLGLGSSSASSFIRLHDSGKIGYTSSVSQTGSYNFYTGKSVGVWRRQAPTLTRVSSSSMVPIRD